MEWWLRHDPLVTWFVLKRLCRPALRIFLSALWAVAFGIRIALILLPGTMEESPWEPARRYWKKGLPSLRSAIDSPDKSADGEERRAGEAPVEPRGRVLLQQAAAVARRLNDGHQMMEAVRQMFRIFAIDELEVSVRALHAWCRQKQDEHSGMIPGRQKGRILDQVVPCVMRADRQRRVELSASLDDLIVTHRLVAGSFLAADERQRDHFRRLVQCRDRLRELLEEDSADPDGFLESGKLPAFRLDRRPAGLRLLLHGSDPALREIAKHEIDASFLSGPTEGPERMGDAWARLARGSRYAPEHLPGMRRRALRWYQKARNNRQGIAARILDDKIDDLRDAAPRRAVAHLLRVVELHLANTEIQPIRTDGVSFHEQPDDFLYWHPSQRNK